MCVYIYVNIYIYYIYMYIYICIYLKKCLTVVTGAGDQGKKKSFQTP